MSAQNISDKVGSLQRYFVPFFVFLNENDNVRSINDVVVLELDKDSNRDIVGYYI